MAGDWIKIEHALPDKPEIVQMAAALGIDQDAVTGKVIRLWIWADQQTEDGNALSVTDLFLDRFTFCPGIAVALRKVGWLNGRDGHLSIPNFSRHNGQTAKQRANTQKRVAKTRNGASVTKVLPEKRREEKSIKKETPTPFPDVLKCSEFEEAWSRWKRHRSEIKKPLKPTQTASMLKTLSEWGLERALAAIEHTITKGWQGLREPEGNSNGGKSPNSSSGQSRFDREKQQLEEMLGDLAGETE